MTQSAGQRKQTCFVIMPFREEFHYFYLCLQRHIELKHNVVCKRGDADILTVPLLDKIRAYIDDADVIIADCSGRNPNVFYELGMAHTLGKPVLLITREKVEEAPADIRHFEFIQYVPTKDEEFFSAIDKALRNLFVDRYADLYTLSKALFKEFQKTSKSKPQLLDKGTFIDSMIAAEQSGQMPDLGDEAALRIFLLPRVVANKDDIAVIAAIAQWYENNLPVADAAVGA